MSRKILIAGLICLLSSTASKAQSLIVGIPSADVSHVGKLEWTHESQIGFNSPTTWNSFNFLTYGIAKNTEVYVSLNNISAPSGRNEALGVGFKRIHSLLHDEADHDNKNHHFVGNDLRLTYGAAATYSFPRNKAGYWVFSHMSYRLPGIYTRITGGLSKGNAPTFGYRSVMTDNGLYQDVANEPLSGIFGFEQPLFKNFSIIADWFTGTHDLACFIPAVQYETKRMVFITGYKIPNNGQSGNHAWVIETMVRF